MFEPLTIVLRVILSLVFLFSATKLLNKRYLANLTYFDYIATTILGTIAGNLAFNIKIDIVVFIFSMLLITISIKIISYISLKFNPIRNFLAGEPITLVEKGKIQEENLTKLHYSYNYLNQQLRQQGIFDINKVETAILEANGELSVNLKSKYSPVTPKDLNIYTSPQGMAIEVIVDGKVLNNNLENSKYNLEWLNNQLLTNGIKDIEEVSYASISSNGKLYIDKYKDN